MLNSLTGAVALHAMARLPSAQARLPLPADDLLNFDAVGLAQLIRQGELSAQEVVEASIARIEALEPAINALTTRNFSAALARAPKIDASTVFAGVPTLLKDLVDYGGVRRTNGSLLHLTQVPQASVAYVKAMEQAGLNILGMTNTPEFASGALTDNLAFGPTRNPWDLTRNAGGSSGGSAAAVAAGYVPLAHGHRWRWLKSYARILLRCFGHEGQSLSTKVRRSRRQPLLFKNASVFESDRTRQRGLASRDGSPRTPRRL
jgi:amidase